MEIYTLFTRLAHDCMRLLMWCSRVMEFMFLFSTPMIKEEYLVILCGN